MRFGVHRKLILLKTPAKVEVSKNSVYTFACKKGESKYVIAVPSLKVLRGVY